MSQGLHLTGPREPGGGVLMRGNLWTGSRGILFDGVGHQATAGIAIRRFISHPLSLSPPKLRKLQERSHFDPRGATEHGKIQHPPHGRPFSCGGLLSHSRGTRLPFGLLPGPGCTAPKLLEPREVALNDGGVCVCVLTPKLGPVPGRNKYPDTFLPDYSTLHPGRLPVPPAPPLLGRLWGRGQDQG